MIIEEVGEDLGAQSERGVAARDVAVGGEEGAGAQVTAQETRQPRQVTVAQPFVVRQPHHAQLVQRFQDVATQRCQIVVVQRPVLIIITIISLFISLVFFSIYFIIFNFIIFNFN